jgi:hypothetical protein
VTKRLRAATLAAAFLVLAHSGQGSAASPSWRFRELAIPVANGVQARVGAVAFDGRRWWIAGSAFTRGTVTSPVTDISGANGVVDGSHVPGLWWSSDLASFTPVEIQPRTGYGEVSELYAVAAVDGRLAAVGAATGGAHGNPRTVSWFLGADDVLREVPASFELYNGLRQIGVRAITATPTGWVIIGTRVNRNERMGAASWTSATGMDFVLHDDDAALSAGPNEQNQGYGVAVVDDRVVAVGERFAVGGGLAGVHAPGTDGIAWQSADGEHWETWTPRSLRLGGPGAQRPQRITSSQGKVLVAGTETNQRTVFLAWVRPAVTAAWTRVQLRVLGSSDDVLSNVTAVQIFNGTYVVGVRKGTRLHLVTSRDGRRWTEVVLPPEIPTGTRATLSLASFGNQLLVGARSERGGGAWVATLR